MRRSTPRRACESSRRHLQVQVSMAHPREALLIDANVEAPPCLLHELRTLRWPGTVQCHPLSTQRPHRVVCAANAPRVEPKPAITLMWTSAEVCADLEWSEEDLRVARASWIPEAVRWRGRPRRRGLSRSASSPRGIRQAGPARSDSPARHERYQSCAALTRLVDLSGRKIGNGGAPTPADMRGLSHAVSPFLRAREVSEPAGAQLPFSKASSLPAAGSVFLKD